MRAPRLYRRGLKKNREFVGACVRFADKVSSELQLLLFDPQTSGGLLIALQPEAAPEAIRQPKAAGCPAMLVGEVVEKASLPIMVC
jgi:selenide, water dikinase